MIEASGFTVERRRFVEQLHFSTDDYLNLVSTYSNRLMLDATARRAAVAARAANRHDRCRRA